MDFSPIDRLRRLRARMAKHWSQRSYVPGWTSAEEQEFARKFVQNAYSGTGEIVDLGCLLGATTIPMAIGLTRNRSVSEKTGRIHAYDLFEWYPWMKDLPGGFGTQYEPGQSFLPEFESRISRHKNLIRTYAGDIQKIGWSGYPIEFLLADATKSWELCDYIYREFFPSLMPGKGLVFEQDFKHFHTPWIHLLHYRLRSNFAVHSALPNTCSVVFQTVRRIDPSEVRMDDLKSASDAELNEAMAFSLSIVGSGTGWEQSNILAAKVMFYIHQERWEEGAACLDRVLSDGYTINSDLSVCKRLLEAGKTEVSPT